MIAVACGGHDTVAASFPHEVSNPTGAGAHRSLAGCRHQTSTASVSQEAGTGFVALLRDDL